MEESRSGPNSLLVTPVQTPHDAGWHADSEMVCRNVSRDNAACTDHNSITNGDAGKDGCIASDPAIITDPDISRKARRVVRWVGAFCGIQSVGYAVEVHVRAEKTSLADFYRGDGSVENVAVPVDERSATDAHVGAIVDEDWRLDVGGRPKAREKIRMAVTWKSSATSCRIAQLSR